MKLKLGKKEQILNDFLARHDSDESLAYAITDYEGQIASIVRFKNGDPLDTTFNERLGCAIEEHYLATDVAITDATYFSGTARLELEVEANEEDGGEHCRYTLTLEFTTIY